ncbi:hypothetical protein ACFY1B_17645 [Streptomyces mirabilis]|uniref:hypothetical protein n=1 Tax=Streptomyces mirabilis TaxID=68239 RepID=UPI0036A5AB9C
MVDTQRTADWAAYSTATHTEWSFASAHTDQQTALGLLSVDYDVAGLNLLKLLVVDGCRALLPLTASVAGGYCAVVVWHSAVTEALQKLFELAWQQATPLGQPVSDGGLTEDERTLTRLLAAGMKDEAVARHR